MAWHVHFTADDLARTRMGAALGPLAETMFALSLLRGADQVPHGLGDWRYSVRGRLTPKMRPLAAMAPKGRFGVDLWTLVGEAPTIEQGIRALESMRTADVEAELEFYAGDCSLPDAAWAIAETGGPGRRALIEAAYATYQALLEPYWPQVSTHLHAERVARGRVLADGGVERLLTTLHPLITWQWPVLTIAIPGAEQHVRLDGRGLLLTPSLFVGDWPLLLTDLADPAAPPRLVFPASRDPGLWHGDAPKGSLAALLGRTRAAALDRIADGCSTTELAGHLGVSVAAASQHATVLRHNGLITTRREGVAVLHTITTLGARLLRVGS